MSGPLRAWVVGYGTMGHAIEEEWERRGHAVSARIDRGDAWPGEDDPDVAFEFTEPKCAAENVGRLLERGVPVVCGTTGWDPGPARSEAERRGVPLVVAPNFSVGVEGLRSAVEALAARISGLSGYDAALTERHHRRKLDAPSGTAAMLADLLEELLGERPEVASLRQGDQPGVHRVIVEGPEEEIELTHRVRSRRPFAAGAVEAAEWLCETRPTGPVEFERVLETGSESRG